MKKKFTPALGYDWLTGFYDFTIKWTMPEIEFRTKLINIIDAKNQDNILEFGYGTGENIILIQKRNNKVKLTGLDIDPKVKEIAHYKISKLGYSLDLDIYDGGTFPYNDNAFDQVFSSLVFHQLNKHTKLSCLREIYRVLKPNGKLVIGDWGRASSLKMRFAFFIVQILDGFRTTSDNVNGLLPHYMELAGFNNVKEIDFIDTKIGTYCYYMAVK